MNSRFKSTGGKEIEEKCPVRIYVISITYILTGQDIYWRFIDKSSPLAFKNQSSIEFIITLAKIFIFVKSKSFLVNSLKAKVKDLISTYDAVV